MERVAPLSDTPARLNSQFVWQAISATAPLLLLPLAAASLCSDWPAWQLMWLFAISIYAGLKWLTFATCPAVQTASVAGALAYLFLWPGMDVQAFLDPRSQPRRPRIAEVLLATLNLFLSAGLLFAAVPLLKPHSPLAAGWAGLVGMALLLHFGLFHLLSIGWRLAGINAQPIMNFPILASSLADFWGRRWNLAFRDLSYRYLLRPLSGSIGLAGATSAVFLVSGLIHDFVISWPVNAGWGGPTLYFLLQGAGLLIERSRAGHRLGLGRGLTGRTFAALFILAPLGLLFHPAFILEAALPTAEALNVGQSGP
jgi:alginate O-acetyltransferase complex protein AlgI